MIECRLISFNDFSFLKIVVYSATFGMLTYVDCLTAND